MTSGPRWREQYDRMFRWYLRLDLNVEHIVGRSEDALIDTFYAFAQACYHLADWLDTPVRRGPAKEYAHNSPVLRFCRDICNGSKHALLERNKVDTQMERTTTVLNDELGSVVEPKLSVHWAGEFIKVDRFAAECIGEWNRFLHTQGLLTSH